MSLDRFDLLPIEMLCAVPRFSDLHTLSILRLVNRWTKVAVEGFVPDKLIIIYAPYILNFLTRTRVASHFTAVQVFDVLCSDSCAISSCGRFKAFHACESLWSSCPWHNLNETRRLPLVSLRTRRYFQSSQLCTPYLTYTPSPKLHTIANFRIREG